MIRGEHLANAEKIRVAIVGGGCAAIATAFELSRPEHNGKYDITVYQMGWRLGGKGASGRGPANRVEEHGFHVWMGFYENAFRLMRECYEELGRDPSICKIATWRDAFFPAPFIGMVAGSGEGSYNSLISYFPPSEGLPGDPFTENNPFSISSYMSRTAGILRTMLMSATSAGAPKPADNPAENQFIGGNANDAPADEALQRITRLLKFGVLASTAGLVEALSLIELIFRGALASSENIIIRLIESIASTARRQLDTLLDGDPALTLLWQTIDLGMTSMLGILRFGLLTDPRGFDAINEYDFREWLRINGASEHSMNSPMVRAAYDLAFAYEDGDYTKPRHGAGTGLRGSLRLLFTYRGAIVWKMSAGMGDIVFAPYYEVLKRRGVSFEFFHRLEQLKIAEGQKGERPFVESLDFDVQAKTLDGGEYDPLVDINGLPCWPSRPLFAQLCDGDRHDRENWKFESHWDRRKVDSKTIRVGVDFDFVVLGIGIGAIPYVCKDLLERDQRWRDMTTHLKTVETQSFQLWMREDMEDLGWPHPPVSLCGFVQPFESFADFRHLQKVENLPGDCRAIVYFLSTNKSPAPPDLSDTEYPARRREEVRRSAIQFLNSQIGQIWPKAVRNGAFRWEVLIAPDEASAPSADSADESRFDTQYWIANVDPTERYALSVPGSQKYRISPLDNTYDNLTVAGDWTACGLDTGCVEAATISGRLAAHAISNYPALEDIVGYDHP